MIEWKRFAPNTLLWPPHIKPFELARSGTSIQPIPSELQPIAWFLAWQLEKIRESCGGNPLDPISGYRSPEYNESIGRKPTSQHTKMTACDFDIFGVSLKTVHDNVISLINSGEIPQGGVGLYPNFVHYDVRGTKARWTG